MMSNIETEPGSSLVEKLEVETEPVTKQPSFQINRDIIETVLPENQPEELRALGITIYNQSTFEEGILKQVDDALKDQEQQSSSQVSSQKKNSIYKNNVLKRPRENEKEKLIRLGHMTPFGTVLGQEKKSNELTSFEKYLLEQERLRNDKLKNSSRKGKSLKSATTPNALSKSTPAVKVPVPKLKKSTKKSFNEGSESDYIPESEGEEAFKSKSKQQIKVKKRNSNTTNSASWQSDDSDWEYSDGEDDDESPKKRRKTNGRVIDDGNVKDYKKRLAAWSSHPDYDEYEEFEGGYRVPLAIWDKLYNYQKVGVRWMYELRLQRCGGILGDEMGLGKTVQVVAFLAGLAFSNILTRLSNYRGLGPVLLVTPATVMHQWVQEFHKWWPPLRVAILHESGSHSGARDSLIKSVNASNGVLVTSYTGVVNYSEALLGLDWDYVILDEGHKIRNPDAQATLAVKQFRTGNRFILSGSPMQNNLKELWSLFDFIFPGKLGTLPVFLQQFAVPITQGGYANASEVQVATAYKCAKVLRDTINPYLLRRMKCDVKDHVKLPPKNEQVLFCRLTEEQRKLYQTYLDSGEIKKIIDGRVQIFVGLTNLRKICNHPDLFEEAKLKDNYGTVESSGKMVVVESLLRIWKEQNHRCLLFSQSRQMLDILETFVRVQGYTYLRLDGTTGIGSRQPLIEKFNNSPEIFLFLLTTRVGGLGVNLTGANRVIIYDPDWNPSTDTQARERAWRIGQRKDVTVYRLLTSGTIEEKIYHRQIFKQYLTNRVLKDPKQRRFFKSNDLYELFTLKETDTQCTETEAIFAGTGSEIANNPHQASSECKDKKDDNEWLLEWKKNREKREAEWRKALENEKRKKELENETAEERKARKRREAEEKKKRKQVQIDGAKVKNVIKISDFRSGAVDEGNNPSSSSTQNDYVLQRLFAKTGVMSAMRHDSIVDAGDPDYSLVEQEAERVAKEAIKELKSSRRNCWNAETGMLSWTGANGSVRQAGAENPKPRFGTKKKVISVGSLKQSTEASTVKTLNKVDSNASQEISLPGTSKMLGSSDLLSRMQARNRLTGLSEPETDNSDDSLQSVSIEEPLILNSHPAPLEFATGVDYRTIMDNIRSFVAFRGVHPGLVTTSDLLGEFNGKLPPRGAPLFRALLNQLCTFSRTANDEGVWQLKPEFQ